MPGVAEDLGGGGGEVVEVEIANPAQAAVAEALGSRV
jgi:hypothetical protein